MSLKATTSSPDQPFSFGPSPHVDTVVRVSQLLGLAGVIPCTLVCKAWHNTMQNPSIWFTLFDTESIPKKQGVLFPYSLKNLKVCANHPVTNKDTKVFGHFDADVLKQCSTISKAVRITLMRKEVPESTRNKTWPQQKEELAENGHVPVKLSTRVFYNATNILNKGICPDKQEGNRNIYSRTSDEIKVGNNVRPSASGGFTLGEGVRVGISIDNARDPYGAAPAVPEEVLRPLAIDYWGFSKSAEVLFFAPGRA